MSYHKKPSFHNNLMSDDVDPDDHEDVPETVRKIGRSAPFHGGSLLAEPDFAPPSSIPIVKTVTPKASSMPVSTPRGAWGLREAPTLPAFRPLERTAVFCENTTPQQVAHRVSDILRQRSIEAHYDDEKAKVKCTNTEGVEFRVRLYRGRGSYSQGIIVEVQRRFGTSIAFTKDVHAILEAAQGKQTPPPVSLSSQLPLVSEVEEDYTPDATSSLEMVQNIMANQGYDSQYLALQTLTSLTDASKMGLVTARAVSLALLSVEETNVVGSKILSLILEKEEEEDVFGLRNMAIGILANAVQTTEELPRTLYEQLRPVLLKELKSASENPRSAYMAARVLECILDADENKADLHDALRGAREAGATRHAALELQAAACLSKFEATISESW